MPLAIRNVDTGLFLDHGRWTPDPSLAQDFPDFESAAKEAVALNLKNADVVTIHMDGRVSGGWRVPLPD